MVLMALLDVVLPGWVVLFFFFPELFLLFQHLLLIFYLNVITVLFLSLLFIIVCIVLAFVMVHFPPALLSSSAMLFSLSFLCIYLFFSHFCVFLWLGSSTYIISI